MKLYAQMGHGDGDKSKLALTEGLIDGAIISPRDCRPESVAARIEELTAARPDVDILLDPQFYATFAAQSGSARTGRLADWPFFAALRKNDLEVASQVERVLQETFAHLLPLPLTAAIAPNIYISRSFDSREAVIAKNFIRATRPVYSRSGDNRPLYATLAVSREALLDRGEFEDFLNDITMLDAPPDGFYVIVGSRGTEARTDIYHADVIARWMLLTHSLKINGFQVINGYSDILAPFLGAAGADAGASGWWSNLRVFSIDRFLPIAGGGRQPVWRYLSVRLLNRILFTERDALATLIPATSNGLPHDADYQPEPDRMGEALQSWEALQRLCGQLALSQTETALDTCALAIARAQAAYSEIAEAGLPLDRRSGDGHLEPLQAGIQAFKELAGLA